MAMRLVRFDTGRADDARHASSAGWNAIATGSSPHRRATVMASGVHSTTAASRLSTATATALPATCPSTGGGPRPARRGGEDAETRREARRAGRRAAGRRWARPVARGVPRVARRQHADGQRPARPPTGNTHAGTRHGRAIEPETPTTRSVTATTGMGGPTYPGPVLTRLHVLYEAFTTRKSRSYSGGSPQRVADAAHGVDQRRVDVVDLVAQVADVGLEHAGVAGEGVVPHALEDLLAGRAPGGRWPAGSAGACTRWASARSSRPARHTSRVSSSSSRSA